MKATGATMSCPQRNPLISTKGPPILSVHLYTVSTHRCSNGSNYTHSPCSIQTTHAGTRPRRSSSFHFRHFVFLVTFHPEGFQDSRLKCMLVPHLLSASVCNFSAALGNIGKSLFSNLYYIHISHEDARIHRRCSRLPLHQPLLTIRQQSLG